MLTNTNDRITTPQTAVAVTSIIIGIGILTLPRTVTEEVGTPDSWISVVLGGMVVMIIGIFMAKLSQMFPEKTIYEYSQLVVGKGLGKLFNLVLIIYFLLSVGLEIRVLAEVTNMYLLVKTPIEVTMIAIMSVCVYLVVGGINPMARLYELLLPVTIVIFLLVFLMGLKIFELNHLRPVMGDGFLPVLKGIQPTTFSYTGYESILILTAFMAEPKKAKKAVLIGIGASIVFYLVTVVMVVGALSADGVVTEIWPTITLFQSFEATGILFERYESFIFAIWILQIFTTFTSFFYFAALGLSQTSQKKISYSIYGLLPVIYLIATIPTNINEVFTLGDIVEYIFYGVVGITIILLIIAHFRRMHHESKG
ncbi:GerAB/ArcD/ProY family transporter [Shimazuella kribbensis]|uniref:GerAB/ArcD/ProY family transporter n=1 Tax=Shimazuella kribbensis TaxID=139808 RepID=UPI000409F643|nr:GerAB/ArcD/ProY family transporter [Shimazuella kribbensis]